MKMKIDAMIFDMDGVVYDSEKMYFAADQKAAQKLGFEFTFDYYKQFIGGGYDLMYNQMVADYGDPELIKRFLELSRDEILPVVKEGMLKFRFSQIFRRSSYSVWVGFKQLPGRY